MNKRLMQKAIFGLHTLFFVVVIGVGVGVGVVNFLSGEDLNGEYWAIFMLMLAISSISIDVLIKSTKQ